MGALDRTCNRTDPRRSVDRVRSVTFYYVASGVRNNDLGPRLGHVNRHILRLSALIHLHEDSRVIRWRRLQCGPLSGSATLTEHVCYSSHASPETLSQHLRYPRPSRCGVTRRWCVLWRWILERYLCGRRHDTITMYTGTRIVSDMRLNGSRIIRFQ